MPLASKARRCQSHLEIVPLFVKGFVDARVAHLGAVRIDGARAVDFAKVGLQCGKLQGKLFHLRRK